MEKVKNFNNKYKVQINNTDINYEPKCGKLLFLDDNGNFVENKRKCLILNEIYYNK